MKVTSLMFATTMLVAVSAVPALAAVRYVGTCGGNPQYAMIQQAVAAAQPDDTIIVCPGTYAETVLVDFSGNTNGVTIVSTDVHEPGLTQVVGAFKIVSSDVTLKGFDIRQGADDNGICVEISGDDATVAFNVIHNCTGGGMRINSISSGNTVHHDLIKDNGFFGINVEGTENGIHHNDVLNNAPEDKNFGGIALADISSNGNVHNNNTAGNKPWGIKVNGDKYDFHQNQVCDGIFLQSSADAIQLHQNAVVDPPGIVDNGATGVKQFKNSSPSNGPF
jgi:hypothetical protein